MPDEQRNKPSIDQSKPFQVRLQPGQLIKTEKLRLEILEDLGRGGNGAVFRALVVEGDYRGLIVAAKFLEKIDEAERLNRFNQEVKVLQELRHPHIIEVLDKGTFISKGKNVPFFVMDYQPRHLGREASAHPRGLHPDLVLPICLQMASALSYLHKNKIIHRDIKPSNILFDGANIRLADFGIADVGDLDLGSAITTPEGRRVAPKFYMSPEQWGRANEDPQLEVGCPSDVFQAGLTFYQILTGINPNTVHKWKGLDRPSIEDGIWSRSGSLSSDLGGLIKDMVHTDPGKRPDASQVQDRLMTIFRAYASHFTALYGVRPGREY